MIKKILSIRESHKNPRVTLFISSLSLLYEKKAEFKHKMAEELNDLLGKLSIRGKKKDIRSTDTKRSKKFEDELRKTDFHIFKSLNDFGYMKWNPKDSKPYKSLRDIEKSTEITCQIDFDGKPSLLKPMGGIRTPKHFITSLRGKEYDNDHVYGQTNAACLHTAVKVRFSL